MADIIHQIGGEEYGTWTIPKDQIREAYKAKRGEEIADDTLDEMSSVRYYSYYKPGEEEVTVKRVDGDTYVGKLYTNTTASPAPFEVDANAGGKVEIEDVIFSSQKGQKSLKEQTKKGAVKDLTQNPQPADQNGNTEKRTEEEAENEVNKALDNNFPDQADEEETGTQDTAQISEINPGTRKKFPTLQYPVTLDPKRQDTINFSMLEYSPKKLTASNGLLGSGSRGKDRKSIGSVTLPIPNGIKDADKVEWGDDSMNAGELALASIAFKAIGEGTPGANAEMTKIRAGLEGIGGKNATDAIASHFTGAAIGKDKGKFMSRATGQIMNPNMELLFNGPSLREFSFTFLLAPRDHKEAKEVIQIIRFFKQGMLPIRSKSNLFLKAPHTFQLKYQTKGENHPYLNSFKECALKSCDVNYTPENSYSTYTDSVMTAYSITLAFSELEPIYNDDYGGDDEFPSHLNFVEGATPATTGVDVQNLTDEERDKLAGTIVKDKSGTDSFVFDKQTQDAINELGNK